MKWLAIALLVWLVSCGTPASRAHGKRVIVLGVDGMDPNFVQKHLGSLPNLARLAHMGGMTKLATTTPPESPVAWATFITGTDPVEHGLFDFVLRDPATLQPFSSMGETREPQHQLTLGPYLFPLSAAGVQTFRMGEPFWQILAEHNIPVTVMRMPTNYPADQHGNGISGMGTPDMEGTFGTFTYYSDDPNDAPGDVSGGRILQVSRVDNRVHLSVAGPTNPLRSDHSSTQLDMVADVDPVAPVARFRIVDQQFVLKQGEWSPWIRVRFPLLPHVSSVAGMFRIYARELQPGFRVYRSPLNADPAAPSLPISAPPQWSSELAHAVGPFYTQGIEEDTSALRQGALSLPEYLEQSRLVSQERFALLRETLRRFKDGFLFFYFSEVDQNSHMLWGKHEAELLGTYQSVDRAIGYVMDHESGATITVMSDHGFAAFDRAVNLNTWLIQQGFQAMSGDRVDWAKTKAYAMGLNALYINLAGREKYGVVHSGAERDAVLADLTRKLREFRDPDSGVPVVADVVELGKSASRFKPDLIVGYAPPYRASWETALGRAPVGVIEDNRDAWIGDHCMAASAVPGTLISTRKPFSEPSLKDLPVTILNEFGIAPGPRMTGRVIY